MRVGKVPVLPYVQPGAAEVADLVHSIAPRHSAFLLASHGPVVSGPSFTEAVYAAEELEETAKLVLLLLGRSTRQIPPDALAALNLNRR